VPNWAIKLQVPGVVYRPLRLETSMEGPESALGFALPKEVRSSPRQIFVDLIRTNFAKESAASGSAEHRDLNSFVATLQPKNSMDWE
jgi:hypothetical protein